MMVYIIHYKMIVTILIQQPKYLKFQFLIGTLVFSINHRKKASKLQMYCLKYKKYTELNIQIYWLSK